MNSTEELIGKPLTILLDGGKRRIGTITGAKTVPGGLIIGATISDESVRKELGLPAENIEFQAPDGV